MDKASHGGRREGAGRKPPEEPYATASYYIPERIKDGILGESLVRGCATSSELAEFVLGTWLDDEQRSSSSADAQQSDQTEQ